MNKQILGLLTAGMLLPHHVFADGPVYRTQITSRPVLVALWPSEGPSALIPEPPVTGTSLVRVDADAAPAGTNRSVLKIRQATIDAPGIRFRFTAPVIDDAVTFTYYVPKGSIPTEVQLALSINGTPKEYTAHIHPLQGQWSTEHWLFSDIVGGDRWRLSALRDTATIGVRVRFQGGGGEWLLGGLRVETVPTDFGALTVPSALAVPADAAKSVQLTRSFAVQGKPSASWEQVVLDGPWKAYLNGKLIASSSEYEKDRALWPDLGNSWKLAAEFPLRNMVEGQNTLTVEMPAQNRAAVAAGWREGTHTKAIIVSDAEWTAVDPKSKSSVPVTCMSLSDAFGSLIADIYPLRLPAVWASAQSPRMASGWPQLAIHAFPLQLCIEKGKWTTGQFTQYGDRWFLKSPSGKPIFALGDQVIGMVRENYAYYRSQTALWPSERKWAQNVVDLHKRLGFNTVAVAATNQLAFEAAGHANMIGLEYYSGEGRAPSPYMTDSQGHFNTHMPDPFDPIWREGYRQAAAVRAKKLNSENYIAGVFVNNEMQLGNPDKIREHSIIGYVYSPACGKEFVRWLRARYGDNIDQLNLAWYGETKKRYHQSFDAILVDKPDPQASISGIAATRVPGSEFKEAYVRDFYEFTVYAVHEYATYMLSVLKDLMPNKLICSQRFQGEATDEMLAAWKDYDIIAWNAYPIWEPGQTCFTDAQLNGMRKAFEITGKPMIISEWGSASYEAGLPGSVVSFDRFRDEGDGYEKVIKQLAGLPFVVGAIHFGWQDLPDTEREAWGIVDSQGNPRVGLVTGIASAHSWLDSHLLQSVTEKRTKDALK